MQHRALYLPLGWTLSTGNAKINVHWERGLGDETDVKYVDNVVSGSSC